MTKEYRYKNSIKVCAIIYTKYARLCRSKMHKIIHMEWAARWCRAVQSRGWRCKRATQTILCSWLEESLAGWVLGLIRRIVYDSPALLKCKITYLNHMQFAYNPHAVGGGVLSSTCCIECTHIRMRMAAHSGSPSLIFPAHSHHPATSTVWEAADDDGWLTHVLLGYRLPVLSPFLFTLYISDFQYNSVCPLAEVLWWVCSGRVYQWWVGGRSGLGGTICCWLWPRPGRWWLTSGGRGQPHSTWRSWEGHQGGGGLQVPSPLPVWTNWSARPGVNWSPWKLWWKEGCWRHCYWS